MKPDLLGQLTTITTLIAANPNFSQQIKLAAHHLAINAKHCAAKKVTPDVIAREIEHLTQEIRLLVK